MQVTEKIYQNVQKLPESFQTEVLDFVEFLLSKSKHKQQDEPDWSTFSLTSAMRGMEDEDTPDYTTGDLKVHFS